MNFELTEDNFILFAIKHYDNPYCKGMVEFEDDLKKFRYIKRLLRKEKDEECSGTKERLIVNHLVVLNNLFGAQAATKMLFFKIEKEYWSQLKTYLVFLNYMPEDETDIPLDPPTIDALRKL